MRYKVGDTVRIRKDLVADHQYGPEMLVGQMLKYLGREAKIETVSNNVYCLDIDKNGWSWSEEMLEPVGSDRFSKKDLQSGMFGETQDGAIFVVAGYMLVYQAGGFDYLEDLNEDLCFKFTDEDNWIARVVKDCHSFDLYKDGYGTELFSRLKPMTLREIEEALGYRIKLVEEKK